MAIEVELRVTGDLRIGRSLQAHAAGMRLPDAVGSAVDLARVSSVRATVAT
jgi:hypothetical protein